MTASTQTDTWRGEFGDQYTDRNAVSEARIASRAPSFKEIFGRISGPAPTSILECGANVGLNLRALSRVTDATLFAVEPNGKARDVLVQDGVVPSAQVRDASLEALPFDDASVDLVFTCGVLIHVAPDLLDQAFREMHRVSAKYLLVMEYFSAKPETITYRGREDLLFKRDFGGRFVELFPSLQSVAQGFCWSKTTGFDDLTWWLFER